MGPGPPFNILWEKGGLYAQRPPSLPWYMPPSCPFVGGYASLGVCTRHASLGVYLSVYQACLPVCVLGHASLCVYWAMPPCVPCRVYTSLCTMLGIHLLVYTSWYTPCRYTRSVHTLCTPSTSTPSHRAGCPILHF